MIAMVVGAWRRSSWKQGLVAGLCVSAGVAYTIAVDRIDLSTASVTAILAAVFAGGFVCGRLVIGAISVDAERVHAQNLALARRAEQADRAFEDAHPPHVECSDEEFAAIVQDELDALPAWIRQRIDSENLGITIADERPGEPRVLGLFHASGFGPTQMAGITLYRDPIVRLATDRASLHRQVHDTLLHELGHLYGMSEADLDRYTIGNNPVSGAHPVHERRHEPGGSATPTDRRP
jgi:predicted Zn-dependent protease with MMP-like domain